MSRVTIKDKTFETSIPEAKILERVKLIADRINKDFEGKTPLFLAVLNGSFMYDRTERGHPGAGSRHC